MPHGVPADSNKTRLHVGPPVSNEHPATARRVASLIDTRQRLLLISVLAFQLQEANDARNMRYVPTAL